MSFFSIYSRFPKSFIFGSAGIASVSITGNFIVNFAAILCRGNIVKPYAYNQEGKIQAVIQQSAINLFASTICFGLSSIALIVHLCGASRKLSGMMTFTSTALCLGTNIISRFIFPIPSDFVGADKYPSYEQVVSNDGEFKTDITIIPGIIHKALTKSTNKFNNLNEDERDQQRLKKLLEEHFTETIDLSGNNNRDFVYNLLSSTEGVEVRIVTGDKLTWRIINSDPENNIADNLTYFVRENLNLTRDFDRENFTFIYSER